MRIFFFFNKEVSLPLRLSIQCFVFFSMNSPDKLSWSLIRFKKPLLFLSIFQKVSEFFVKGLFNHNKKTLVVICTRRSVYYKNIRNLLLCSISKRKLILCLKGRLFLALASSKISTVENLAKIKHDHLINFLQLTHVIIYKHFNSRELKVLY